MGIATRITALIVVLFRRWRKLSTDGVDRHTGTKTGSGGLVKPSSRQFKPRMRIAQYWHEMGVPAALRRIGLSVLTPATVGLLSARASVSGSRACFTSPAGKPTLILITSFDHGV